MTKYDEETYCVDIEVGPDERGRQTLIAYLRAAKEESPILGLSSAQCGVNSQGAKLLRVYTENGEDVLFTMEFLYPLGEACMCTIHRTQAAAERESNYRPDPGCPDPFDF